MTVTANRARHLPSPTVTMDIVAMAKSIGGPGPELTAFTPRIRWHETEEGAVPSYDPTPRCGREDQAHLDREHLHVYCQTCAFDWIEPLQ